MLSTIIDRKLTLLDTAPEYTAEYELAVCGLGTAGAEAAIHGASLGMSVLGIERLSGMGGLSTLGCVWDYYYGTDGGSWEKWDEIAVERAKTGYTLCYPDSDERRCYPGIVREYVLEEKALELGVTLSYRTTVTGVFMENDRVTGLRLLRGGRQFDVRTGCVIDCTGNASVCRLAGCEISYGRDWDGAQMAFSKTIGLLTESGGMPIARGRYTFNGRLTDPSESEYSNSLLRAAASPPNLPDKLSERFICLGALPGTREDAHVVTLETLTMDECVRGIRQDNPIFHTFVPQDLSNVDRDHAYESEVLCDWFLTASMGRYGFSAAVPMGALIPRGAESLLVAGKPIGIDHDLSGGLRMQKDMKKSAEAAAVIAYLGKIHDCQPAEVPYDELSEMLTETGCMAAEYYIGIGDLHEKTERGIRTPSKFPQTAEEFRRSLSKPAIMPAWSMPTVFKPAEADSTSLALWAARQLRYEVPGETVELRDALHGFISTEKCGYNFAIALGLAGDERACPYLLEMIKNPPAVTPGEYPAQIKAICLLGRLGYAPALPVILDIIEDNAETLSRDMPCEGYLRRRGDCVSHILAFSLFAAHHICNAHPELRDTAGDRIRSWAAKPIEVNAGWFGEDVSGDLLGIAKRCFI